MLLSLASLSYAAKVLVPVEVISSREGLEVFRNEGFQRVPLCTAPCSFQLDASTPSLTVSGRGLTSAVVLLALEGGEPVRVQVRPGARGAATVGSLFSLAAAGLLIGSTVSFAVADDKAAAGAALGGALFSGLIALPLSSVGKTRTEVTYGD